MTNWNYDPNQYTARNFALVPEGDHRVRIVEVTEKLYSTGNEGFQITLEVAGHTSKVWYHLILDPMDRQKTNQRIGMFFDSFGITNYDLTSYHEWKNKTGAVRVKHEIYNGKTIAKVLFCLSKVNQQRLPEWQDMNVFKCEDRSNNEYNSSSPKTPFNKFAGFSF